MIYNSMYFQQWLLKESFTKEQAWELADLQRDIPERAMLKVQFAMGGGVMNSAVEHIGDLIHRMTERPTFSSAGYEFVKEKVTKTLMWLTNDYGFAREFEENIDNNAIYYFMQDNKLTRNDLANLDAGQQMALRAATNSFRKKVYDALEVYANEHAKLPVYNKAQQYAQKAAVSLGRREFRFVVLCLLELKSHLSSKEKWIEFAHEGLEQDGNNPS